jgi:O-antigen ligase
VNNTGTIKYARAKDAGAGEWRRDLRNLQAANPNLPDHEVFLPKFQVYDEYVLVRFDGSARPFEAQLADNDIDLLFDNVGLAPANLVPRWRSFPRNALTYAGISAALFPLALFLAWTQKGGRRRLGQLGAFACLIGAGFALARGAWVAILIGIAYVLVDGLIHKRQKIQVVGAFLIVAVLLTGVYLVLYDDDPLTARAGAESSVITRQELYEDTVSSVNTPLHFVMGFGTELPRTETGEKRRFGEYGRFVPRAGTHSTYLNYLFRAGIVGAAAIIALYALAALHSRAASRERRGVERTFSSLATAAVLTVAAHAAILSLYVEPVYTLVVSLVLGLAMAGAMGLSRSILPWRGRDEAAGAR